MLSELESLLMSISTSANGGRFGEANALKPEQSTLVTRLPLYSFWWKYRPTCEERYRKLISGPSLNL